MATSFVQSIDSMSPEVISKCIDRLLKKSSFTGFRFLISAVLVVNCQENNEEQIAFLKRAIHKSKEKFTDPSEL